MADENEVVETTEPTEVEERARRMGWRPKEEYNGPPERWVDADTFVSKGETELPIIRERFRRMDERLVATERELTRTRGTLSEATTKLQEQSDVLTELRDLSRTAERRTRVKLMAELEDRERRAVSEADTSAYDQIQHEKRQLDEIQQPPAPKEPPRPTPPPPPQAPAGADRVVMQWVQENPWFNNDPELNAVATSLHGVYLAQNPNQPLEENLQKVTETITSRFPEKFSNVRRAAPSAVASPTAPAPKPKGKTVADLPPDARQALAKIKREIPDYKDAEYLRVYFGEGEQISA